MTRTARRNDEARERAFNLNATAQRMQAAELFAARRDMELMERLEWYGQDLEVAMAYNDTVLFNQAAALCRPVGK